MVEAMNRIVERCKEGYSFGDACMINSISPKIGECWRKASKQFDKEIEEVLNVEKM